MPGEAGRTCAVRIPFTTSELRTVKTAAALDAEDVREWCRSKLLERARSAVDSEALAGTDDEIAHEVAAADLHPRRGAEVLLRLEEEGTQEWARKTLVAAARTLIRRTRSACQN